MQFFAAGITLYPSLQDDFGFELISHLICVSFIFNSVLVWKISYTVAVSIGERCFLGSLNRTHFIQSMIYPIPDPPLMFVGPGQENHLSHSLIPSLPFLAFL